MIKAYHDKNPNEIFEQNTLDDSNRAQNEAINANYYQLKPEMHSFVCLVDNKEDFHRCLDEIVASRRSDLTLNHPYLSDFTFVGVDTGIN